MSQYLMAKGLFVMLVMRNVQEPMTLEVVKRHLVAQAKTQSRTTVQCDHKHAGWGVAAPLSAGWLEMLVCSSVAMLEVASSTFLVCAILALPKG